MILPLSFALLLSWQAPRDFKPAFTQFIITYALSSQPASAEMSTDPSAEGACADVPESDVNTFCAVWPTCPPAGDVLFFWVQAAVGADRSDPQQTPLACHITAGCACELIAMDGTPPAGIPGTPRPTPSPTDPSPTATLTLPPLPTFAPQYPPAPT